MVSRGLLQAIISRGLASTTFLCRRLPIALTVVGLAGGTLVAGSTARAAAWHLDHSFGRHGVARIPLRERGVDSLYLPGPGDMGSLLTSGPRGSLFVGGYGRENGSFRVARLSARGDLAASFGHGGVSTVAAIYSRPEHPPRMFALAGGGLLVIGLDQMGRFVAVRLSARGQLDRGFGHRGVAQYELPHAHRGAIVAAAAVESNGDILAAYYRKEVPQPFNEPQITPGLGEGPLELLRLRPSGALDRSFGAGGFLVPTGQPPATGEGVACGVSLAPDGSVLLAYEQAAVPNSDGRALPAVQDLDPAGADASGFGDDGVTFLPFQPRLEGVDSVIFGGLFALPHGAVEVSFGGGGELFRFTSTGAADPAFAASGHSPGHLPGSVLALAPDGETFAVKLGKALTVLGTLASGTPDPGLGGATGRRFASGLPTPRPDEERPAFGLLPTNTDLSILVGDEVVRIEE